MTRGVPIRSLAAATLLLAVGCTAPGCDEPAMRAGPGRRSGTGRAVAFSERAEERERMVAETVAARGVRDERVLAALRAVPRHALVPPVYAREAYGDSPLPIGYGQTISQPYIVGLMTEALKVGPGDRVLEVGTGSGYQAAVLAEMGCRVYSIEIVEPLHQRARADLAGLGYGGVELRCGDGYRGWPEAAPFAAIVVTAAPDHVPAPLVEQLAEGGRLVLPVGGEFQDLRRITRAAGGLREEVLEAVRFVPMTGEAERR